NGSEFLLKRHDQYATQPHGAHDNAQKLDPGHAWFHAQPDCCYSRCSCGRTCCSYRRSSPTALPRQELRGRIAHEATSMRPIRILAAMLAVIAVLTLSENEAAAQRAASDDNADPSAPQQPPSITFVLPKPTMVEMLVGV